MTAVNVPKEAKPGLDLFAAAWLDRFLSLGGDLIAQDDGRLSSWVPEPGIGRRPEQNDYTRAHTDGAFRELYDLLAAVPGGRTAVWAHVRLWGASKTLEGVATW